MSFESPDFFKSVDEKAKYVAPSNSEVTKGEQVGGDASQKNAISGLDPKNEQEKSGEKNTVHKSSIKEMNELAKIGGEKMKQVAGMNPDWPPAAGNPEAESKLAGSMENSLNMVA